MEMNANLNRANPRSVLSGDGEIASPADYRICRVIMRNASNNYSTASNYLPADLLPHVEAVYALMRVGDDRVDVSHHGFASPLEAIDDWERNYWQAFERGDSPHPVLRAYLDTALRFGIPRETMAAYFRAMRADLSMTRFPTFQDLMHYIQGSAIPVGRALTHILGVRAHSTIEQALPGADSLSIAMQLSNFWRDIAEDWRKGRIYLPLEDMHAFNYTESDLAAGRVNPSFRDLLEFEFARTEKYYERAKSSVRLLAHGQWAVMSALEIYRAILTDIRARGYDVFSDRAGTRPWQKAGLVIKAYWQLRQS